jgi:uncharacterized protein YodC (DUF2158 family)
MKFNIGDKVVHKSDNKSRSMIVVAYAFKETPPSTIHNERANMGIEADKSYYCTWISGSKKGEGYFIEEELNLED